MGQFILFHTVKLKKQNKQTKIKKREANFLPNEAVEKATQSFFAGEALTGVYDISQNTRRGQDLLLS